MHLDEIKTICNLGTGTMGHGTAVAFAAAGYKVRMFGRSDDSVERGLKGARAALALYREHGVMGAAEAAAAIGRIQGVTTLAEAAAADFVIESVAEELTVKQTVFAELDKLCPAHTIFATNTSGLSPTAVAEAVGRKDKFIAAHFWNPPHLVPLVEVAPGALTSPATAELTWKLMEKIGKKPVALQKEALGFIGNRLQMALLREALYIVEQGIATPEAVDTTVKYSLGRRLATTGPLESADLGGLDIFYHIASYLAPDLCSSGAIPARLQKAMAEHTLGTKTGKGIYDWTDGKKEIKMKKNRETALLEWLRKDREQTF